jgi:hypothetical protein
MREFGNTATMVDVIRERRSDAKEIDDLQSFKANGRDVTKTRAIPTAFNDILPMDKAGDKVVDNMFFYELQQHGSVLRWAKIAQNTGF